MSEDSEYQSDERLILNSIDKWVVGKVAPVASRLERADEYPHELVDDMRELGLFGCLISQEYGGLGLSAATFSRVVARIAEEWMSLTGIFGSHSMMASIVQRFGTPKQREYWLPKFASGNLRGGIGLTEPVAGTDLQGIKTRARRLPNGNYVVDGAKTWITNAIEGHCLALLVKTDVHAQPRHKGMSILITPKIDPQTRRAVRGVTAGRKLPKIGYRGIDTGEISFEGYECDAELCLVGGEEGGGFFMAASVLEVGRINVAARGVGIARRALSESLKYAKQRQTMGKPISEHQAIQLKLGEMATKCRAAELLVADAAAACDEGRRADMEAGMAKYFATETAAELAFEAMRIHGGNGYSEDYPIARLYRDAPLLCIGEGTNEMQRIIIAKQLVARSQS